LDDAEDPWTFSNRTRAGASRDAGKHRQRSHSDRQPGKVNEVEAMHRQELKGSERDWGAAGVLRADCGNLAVVLHSKGKYEESKAMH